ncbi:MAG: hypothetical protein PHZ22_05395 [Bacteroidales bacterium]|nr:hypothetical protein [Bacteroidales bacterium]
MRVDMDNDQNAHIEIEFEGRTEQVVLKGNTMDISWSIGVIGENLYEVPYLCNAKHLSKKRNNVQTKINNLIMEKIGLIPKVLPLSPVTKSLPLPPWTESYPEGPDDYSNAGILVKYYFVSEAKALALEFEKKLQEYREGL